MGDVNSDGVPDLAVGSPGQRAVVILSGVTGARLHTLRSPSPQVGANFGATLVEMGDGDGDGVHDFAVGAPGQDVGSCCDQGQVTVFSGVDGTRLLTLPPRPQPGANFGTALTSVGDINGDGVPDLAVSAPGQDARGLVDLGQVFVFSVSTSP